MFSAKHKCVTIIPALPINYLKWQRIRQNKPVYEFLNTVAFSSKFIIIIFNLAQWLKGHLIF